MQLRRYLALVWKWAWLLTLGFVLGTLLGYAYSKSQTPTYEASATLLVTPASNGIGQNFNDILAGQQLARTFAQMITTRPVLTSAAKDLGLTYSYEQLLGMTSVDLVRDTQLIKLTVESSDPSLAAKVTNQVANEFIKQNDQSQLARFQSSK